MIAEMWNDEIGRCFCDAHRREKCHECCFDFGFLNRQTEVELGMRKPPTKIEDLAEKHVNLVNDIKLLEDNRKCPNDSIKALEILERQLNALRAAGHSMEVNDALTTAHRKSADDRAEKAAILNAWSKQNPGKATMEYGGPEMQRFFEQVAALPPSASIDRADKFTCSYCSKSSTEKLLVCSQCRSVAYCNRECQKLAWKGHKKVCTPKEVIGDEKKTKLPLTWEQLEAFGGFPAEGKVCFHSQ